MKRSEQMALVALQLATESISKSSDADSKEAVQILDGFKKSLQDEGDRSDSTARLDTALRQRALRISGNGKKLMEA